MNFENFQKNIQRFRNNLANGIAGENDSGVNFNMKRQKPGTYPSRFPAFFNSSGSYKISSLPIS